MTDTPTQPGVSVTFLAGVVKLLERRYGKHAMIDHPTLNRWIAELGRIEQEYKALPQEKR